MAAASKRRIFELDLLRGLFIIIIIIDHLQFWPSPLRYITGEGRLWVTAAEGFFLISGLLIGYIRAYKGKKKSLKELTGLLVKRAGLLYVWGVLITVAITVFTISVGGHDLLPKLPTDAQLASPLAFLWSVLTMEYFNDWIYFLRLYAIMLLATPIFLWLIRKGHERIVPFFALTLYIIGFIVPESALQWQALFFGAALIGYRLEDITRWFRERPTLKRILLTTTILASLATMIISFFFVHGWHKVEDPHWEIMDRTTYVTIRESLDPIFSLAPLAVGRLTLAFLWFGGLLMLFHVAKPFILRFFGWLLLPLGERSLSAYCLQAIILPFIVITLSPGGEFKNTIIALLTTLLIWGMLQVKFIQKIIPR